MQSAHSTISKILFISILFSIILTQNCCSRHKSSVDHPQNMLRVDVGSEIPTFDPQVQTDTASARVLYDLFAGLVDFDQQNNIISGMADKWDISTDGLVYTFHLRDGLTFSDGSTITARDFVYSWQRLVDPKTASPYNFLLEGVAGATKIMKGEAKPDTLKVAAPDANTFVVTLTAPNPAFIKYLVLPNLAVVPELVIKKYGSKWIDPRYMVTSGAYKLKEHVVNGYILAEKNPYYYNKNQVKIQQVKYLPYGDKNAAIPSYQSGGLDITFQNVPIDQMQELKKMYPDQLKTVSQEGIYYYNFNLKNPVFAHNIKLRQALSMAIDREALTKSVLKQEQQPLYSTVTATVEHGAYKAVRYDWANLSSEERIKQAKILYNEAGYNKEHPLTITISYNTNDVHKKVALAVASMWKNILGVDVELRNQEWKTFLQTRFKGDFQVARNGWSGDYDSVTTYTPLYQCGNQQNNSHDCDLEYNKLLEQAQYASSKDQQIKLYQKALQRPLDNYTVIPLFQYTYTVLVKPYVHGYEIEKNYLDHVQSKWLSLK